MITGPLPPPEAADASLHTKEITYHTAAKHGLTRHLCSESSQEPKWQPDPRSYLCSFKEDHQGGRGPLASRSIPALAALTLLIPASYERVVDGDGPRGTYVHWGTGNREALVPLTNATSPSSRRVEIRFLDGPANPYLALAGILGSRFAGIPDKVPLDLRGEDWSCKEKRRALGIMKRMPLTWKESGHHLREDSLTVLGPELTDISGMCFFYKGHRSFG